MPWPDRPRAPGRGVARVSIAGFLLAQGVAVVLLAIRRRELASMGGRASAMEQARVGLDPLLAAMAGWGLLVAGVAAVRGVGAVRSKGWTGWFVVLLLGVPGALVLVSAGRTVLAPRPEGPPLPHVPPWVEMLGGVAGLAHPPGTGSSSRRPCPPGAHVC